MKHKIYKKIVLVILDGFGVAPASHGNAISLANIPTLNRMVSNYPSMTLQASGPLVGLPWGEMGNSEVGHLNIGAGRIVGQDLVRISNAIRSGIFFKNQALKGAIEHAKTNKSNLHILGLISPGGVHSLDEHAYAILGLCAQENFDRVYVHMFTDGRDTDPKVALRSLAKLEDKFLELGLGQVATVTGRFFAMDRGQHWSQTVLTFQALAEGMGETAGSAEDAIKNNYNRQIFDEMIKPTVIVDALGKPVVKISDNDAIIFINFRSDRALQLTQAFVSPEKTPLKDSVRLLGNVYFTTLSEYNPSLPVNVAFSPIDLKNNLSQVISEENLSQLHVAESEKYAHITSFFNCGRVEKFPLEDWIIVTSPENSRNYVDHPEMSAPKLTETLTEKILQTDINFFVANFANTDMVGHTGNLQSAVLAVESIDRCLGKVWEACEKSSALLIITADHGNVENMLNFKSGDIDPDHTTNPVPFLLIAEELKFSMALDNFSFLSLAKFVPSGVICDIAPTILDFFGIKKPEEMTGFNLFEGFGGVPKK